MNKGSRVLFGVMFLLIGVGMIFNNFSLLGSDFNDSDSISLKSIDKIIVKGSSEDIRIIKSNGSDLKAELTGKSIGLSFNKPKVEIKKSGNNVTVRVKRSIFQMFSSSKLELDIFISDDYKDDLSLNLSSGNLNVEERFDVNILDIDISSGDMVIDEINSDEAKINVSSGSLTIKSFTGDIDGEISSGDVEIDYLAFDNDIKFHASSGSVEIALPEGSDFDLYGTKSSGSIKIEFDLSDYSKSDGTIKGTAGNGGNKIDLDVSSGSISIDER